MNIVDSENCLFCKEYPETIEHIYLSCTNSIKLWNETIFWVRSIYDPHFMISDHEQIFGCLYSEITQKTFHGKYMLNTNTSITMDTFLSKQFVTL